MAVTLRSFAKINLGLAIGPVRADGFHALTTLYQTIEAHDLVTVSVERVGATLDPASAIVLSSNSRWVPLDGRNTVWKMLTPALDRADRRGLRVRVHIDKRLPVQGGLGGGSANAVAALVGLERELARDGLAAPLSGAERLRMATAVGSDVPLFLLGGSVLGVGRGEQVMPLADLAGPAEAGAEANVSGVARVAGDVGFAGADRGDAERAGGCSRPIAALIALPREGVSTPAAFRAWDESHSELTSSTIAGRLEELSRALAAAWAEQHATGVFAPLNKTGSENLAGTLLSTLVQTGILLNDFEEVVFRQHPLLEQIKRVLAGQPAGEAALYSALSGSGSAVFGLYADEVQARAAEERLNALDVRSLRTQLLGRAAYWASMVAGEE